MRRCVWSRNLKNEEAMARVGPQRHRGNGKYISIYYNMRMFNDGSVQFISIQYV